MHTTDLYFECHVTTDPVYGKRLLLLKRICRNHDFRVAELLMKKGGGKYGPVHNDAFMSARSESYTDLEQRMEGLLAELQFNDYSIRRYKIENTLLDVRP